MSDIHSDDAIRAMFERRAARAQASDLRESIAAARASTKQTRSSSVDVRRIWRTSRSSRYLVVAAVAGGLLSAALGVAIVGRQPPAASHVSPVPSRSAANVVFVPLFDLPFSYVSPPGHPDLQAVYQDPSMQAWTVGDSKVYPDDDRSVATPARGIVVATVHNPVTHPCPEGSGLPYEMPVRLDHVGFFEDLRVTSVRVGVLGASLLDGRPATVADLDWTPNDNAPAESCEGDSPHIDGAGGLQHVSLRLPSRMYITEVRGESIIIQIWATSRDELKAWLPDATAMVESIDFADQ